MGTVQSTLLNAGSKDQVLSDFSAICETTTIEGQLKYNERPTLETLAKIITAQNSGPNKDIALYELAHLIHAVAENQSTENLQEFFLYPEKAIPATYRAKFGSELDHLHFEYDAKSFDIRFGRVPVLVCLYEFLTTMDNFAYYDIVNELCQDLISQKITEKNIRTFANKLGSHLRKYRISYISSFEADGKFAQVLKFLKERNTENQLIIEDGSILDFWSLHNQGKDYKGYRTVFDLFCDFNKAFNDAHALANATKASSLGLDREQGEIDVADSDVATDYVDAWHSPLSIFDEEDIKDTRFFKKSSERQPIENLMAYGPDAIKLPLAFLRYEIFGQVQNGITNDLQVGRGKASVANRITCEDAQTYQDRATQCEKILEHIKQLQKACLHVIQTNGNTVIPLDQETRASTQNAFAKLNRKGFDDTADYKTFHAVSENLVIIATQLQKYIDHLNNRNLESCFDEDKAIFSQQFELLYQKVLQ